MDITAAKRGISEHTYSREPARTEASATGFSRVIQEAESRLKNQETESCLQNQEAESCLKNQEREQDTDIREEDLWQAIAGRKEEIIEKLRNGDTEEKFQIGAGSYTQKEWERMMEQFDSLEEIIKRMMSERVRNQRQQAYWQALGKPEQEEETER